MSQLKKSPKKTFRAISFVHQQLSIADKLNCSFFFDCQFTSVVTAFATYSVINVPSTAVRAYSHCWSDSLVMSSSLGCSCLTLSSFRMCHYFIYLIVIILFQTFKCIPSGIRSSCIIFYREVVIIVHHKIILFVINTPCCMHLQL